MKVYILWDNPGLPEDRCLVAVYAQRENAEKEAKRLNVERGYDDHYVIAQEVK